MEHVTLSIPAVSFMVVSLHALSSAVHAVMQITAYIIITSF